MTAPRWTPLRLKTITPAFLGHFPDHATARPTEIPFPIPSLRGVLAYWLRTVAGPYIGPDISELLRVESELFGRPADAGPSRPSRIMLRADRVKIGPPGKPPASLGYLMGPGLTDDDQPPPRKLWPGRLSIDVRNTGAQQHADLFLSALWALRTFGGIGARCRRGFGTLAFDQLPSIQHGDFDRAWLIRNHINDLDDVLACTAQALEDLGFARHEFGTEEPRYPCFAPGQFRVDERPITTGPVDDVLGRVGKLLRALRHPKPSADWEPPDGNPFALPRTEGYLKVARPYADGGTPQPWPFTDGALGLPIVYTVQHHTEPVTVESTSDGVSTRRASPLWLRVTNPNTGWRLRSLAFCSEWLPQQDQLQVKNANRSPIRIERPSPAHIRNRIDEWFDRISRESADSL